jgi:hypothetical protein
LEASSLDLDGQVVDTVGVNVVNGFFGVAERFTGFSDKVVSPIVEIAFGTAFQSRPQEAPGCSHGFTPTGQLGLGASIRVATDSAILVFASGSYVFNSRCDDEGGAREAPFVGGGYGLHVGASLDIPAAPRSEAEHVSRRYASGGS